MLPTLPHSPIPPPHVGTQQESGHRKKAHVRTQPHWCPGLRLPASRLWEINLSHLLYGIFLRQPELTNTVALIDAVGTLLKFPYHISVSIFLAAVLSSSGSQMPPSPENCSWWMGDTFCSPYSFQTRRYKGLEEGSFLYPKEGSIFWCHSCS